MKQQEEIIHKYELYHIKTRFTYSAFYYVIPSKVGMTFSVFAPL